MTNMKGVSKPASANSALDGFKILSVKFSSESSHPHQIFVKQHNIKSADLNSLKPPQRTLFCANIPPWLTHEALKVIFQKLSSGSVSAVYLQHEPSVGPPTHLPDSANSIDSRVFSSDNDPYKVGSGFRYAYVVFDRAADMRRAFDKINPDNIKVASTEQKPILVGMQKWIKQYNDKIVAHGDLLTGVKGYIEKFDESERARQLEEEREANEADEDGWITVTKASKNKAGKQAEDESVSKEGNTRGKNNRRKKKKKATQLVNFYSHQVKEDKLAHIQQLRKKFEEDKAKIAKMKADRKFRPF